jgi:flagellar biosynthesis chaperone FliJ
MPEEDGKTKPAAAVVAEPEDQNAAALVAEAVVPPDPVAEAKRKLEKAKNDLADAESAAKRDDEIAKAIAQYKSEQLQLEADEGGLKAQYHEAREELRPTDAERATVRAVKNAANDVVDTLDASVATQREALEQARATLAADTNDLAETKAAYEATKTLGKNVQAKHRIADGLRKDAFDAIARQKRHLAYYLLRHRLEPTIEDAPLPVEVEAYIAEIKRQSRKLGDLSASCRDQEAEIKDKEAKLAADEKALADLRKALDANIRTQLAARP